MSAQRLLQQQLHAERLGGLERRVGQLDGLVDVAFRSPIEEQARVLGLGLRDERRRAQPTVRRQGLLEVPLGVVEARHGAGEHSQLVRSGAQAQGSGRNRDVRMGPGLEHLVDLGSAARVSEVGAGPRKRREGRHIDGGLGELGQELLVEPFEHLARLGVPTQRTPQGELEHAARSPLGVGIDLPVGATRRLPLLELPALSVERGELKPDRAEQRVLGAPRQLQRFLAQLLGFVEAAGQQ